MYLNCKTYFSFRYGTFGTEELVKSAVEFGATALGLTNINTTCDIWDFVQHCQQNGIKPIAGAEIRNGDKLLYILLAANNRGFAWINEFLSVHLQSDTPFPEKTNSEPFFIDVWDGFVIYPINNKPLQELFPNERIGVLPSEITKLHGWDFRLNRDKIVVRQPVTFQNKTYFNVHKLLRAIGNNVLLSKLPADTVCSTDEYFLAFNRILDAFKQYPFIVTNTYKLIDACTIEMDFGKDKNKKTFSASLQDDRMFLQKLAFDGLHFRYGTKNKIAEERVNKELAVIDELGFNSYFLIAWDLIRYARSHGILLCGSGQWSKFHRSILSANNRC